MKTILKSHGLWDLVENGFDSSDPKKEKKKIEESEVAEVEKLTMAEILMKDARALRLFDIMNQMKSYGEDLSREKVVQKLLISLPRSYDPICSMIEHSKDLETLEVQKVVAFLKSFELRLDRHAKDSTERAFASLNVGGKPKCTGCGKFGHVLRDCNGNKTIQKVNYANQVEETSDERLLVNIQRNLTSKVKMGTGEIVHVAGKGTLVMETKLGMKHIQEVMLVPGLKENFLSVGQMVDHGYYLMFGGNVVNIFDGWSLNNLVIRVQMTNNRFFPLTIMPANQLALKANVTHYL
ncbi:PREDICTED: uncharacterized protein LOC103337221 [Prunus mume]|uniref:Uncharacterized protein LOC103337221 n=1 Tax=Prunus mume TaxID=102107 RepID=A0ABM0PEU0_PRUMU|nr:PREDICTED: uncharacterized protein LOC103337221 [Prunus mume]